MEQTKILKEANHLLGDNREGSVKKYYATSDNFQEDFKNYIDVSKTAKMKKLYNKCFFHKLDIENETFEVYFTLTTGR